MTRRQLTLLKLKRMVLIKVEGHNHQDNHLNPIQEAALSLGVFTNYTFYIHRVSTN